MNHAIGIMSYKKPYLCEVTRNWETDETKVTTSFIGNVDESLFDDAAFSVKRLLHIDGGEKAPTPAVPERVIFNDPATVVFWSDGTKTVTKCRGCDEYEPLFGIMACALRKIGRNKVRIDAWENVLAFLANSVADADECRVLADMLNATADVLDSGAMNEILLHETDKVTVKKDDELECQPLFDASDGNMSVTVVDDDKHDKHEGPTVESLLRELFGGNE